MKVRHDQERRCAVFGCDVTGDETDLPVTRWTREGWVYLCHAHVGETEESLAKGLVTMRVIAMRKRQEAHLSIIGQEFGG